MNWNAVSAIGEILGALAVVLSLVYLASEVRIQNREARMASVHEIVEAFRDSINAFQDPDRAQVFVAGVSAFDDLSDSQRLQFIAMSQGILRVWEEAYYQRDEGRLDERIWQAMLAQWKDFRATPGAQRVWELRRHTYSVDFRSFVESLEGGQYDLG